MNLHVEPLPKMMGLDHSPLQIHLLQSLSADYRMHFNELFKVGCSAMLVEVTSIHSHSIFKMVVYGSYFAWIFDDFDAFLFCFLILTLAFIPTPLAFRDFAFFCKKSCYFCQRFDSSKRSADVGTRHARVTRRTSLH